MFLKSVELEYEFELGYKDLFVFNYDAYYFLMNFETMFGIDEWTLSLPFLRKYSLSFNPEKKTITFYNPNIQITEAEKRFSPLLKLVLYSTFAVLFTILGVFIGKILYKKIQSRKKAYMLEDEYDYNNVGKEKRDGPNLEMMCNKGGNK